MLYCPISGALLVQAALTKNTTAWVGDGGEAYGQQRFISLSSGGWEVPGQDASRFGVRWEPASWVTGGRRKQELLGLLGSTQSTSSNPSYLPKTSPSVLREHKRWLTTVTLHRTCLRFLKRRSEFFSPACGLPTQWVTHPTLDVSISYNAAVQSLSFSWNEFLTVSYTFFSCHFQFTLEQQLCTSESTLTLGYERGKVPCGPWAQTPYFRRGQCNYIDYNSAYHASSDLRCPWL